MTNKKYNPKYNPIRSQWTKMALALTVALPAIAAAPAAHAVPMRHTPPPATVDAPAAHAGAPAVSRKSRFHPAPTISLTQFMREIDAGHIKQVGIDEGSAIVTFTDDGSVYQTRLLPESIAAETAKMVDKGVDVTVTSTASTSGLPGLTPLLLFGGAALLGFGLLRKSVGGPGRAAGQPNMSAKARDLSENEVRITLADVAGVDEAVSNMQDVLGFLKNPEKYKRMGAKPPRGTLLVGPPGTGKTLLARAIAGEARVPFLTMNGSDFVEMLVGVGAKRVRELVAQARAKEEPCIIFIDEIDVIGQRRGANPNTSSEHSNTLTALLTEMDGSNEANDSIIYIGTTNIPETLDPALTRDGRFGRQVVVPNPDLRGREQILAIHGRKHPNDVDIKAVAKKTPGFSGAALANLWNEAALRAIRLGDDIVTMSHVLWARETKLMGGEENRTKVMSDEEKRMTAYHEGGHALMAIDNPLCDPIEKATIVPRGRGLGFVRLSMPEQDAYTLNKEQCVARLNMMMGGRAAEEIMVGKEKISSGASGDIEQATKLVKTMITKWGFSDVLGLVAHGSQGGYLGGGGANAGSEATAALIDQEAKQIVGTAYDAALATLRTRLHDLHMIAQGLLTYETLDGAEITALLKGEPIRDHAQPFQPPSLPILAHEKPSALPVPATA
jgi:cell division protease FtsH